MTAILGASVPVDIGRSLREGFFMFWETLWPLILGFGLSGAVQAFVSRDSMQKKLGDHRAHADLHGAWRVLRDVVRALLVQIVAPSSEDAAVEE